MTEDAKGCEEKCFDWRATPHLI